MSVDPFAETYAGYSPYNYTMGNPIKFIDPDGMRVSLFDRMEEMGAYHGESTDESVGTVGTDPSPSLLTAYGNALNALADSRAESVIAKFSGGTDELYGSLINYDEVKGYKYSDKFAGINPNRFPFKNVTLQVDGQSVVVDEISFFVGPPKYNIITGVREAIDMIVDDAGNPLERPAYEVMGIKASRTIRTRSGVTISENKSGPMGRVQKGWIIARGNNHRRLESILQRRTRRIVLNHVNANYSGERKTKLINWLETNKYIVKP